MAVEGALWSAVDGYLEDVLLGADPVLEAALAASAEAGLPPIAVSPTQGRLLSLLARIRNAHTILEIGTLGGYSTICLARALPAQGRLISLEINARHAEVARANLARAGLGDAVEIRVGPALDTLPTLEREGLGKFDMVFIDADKASGPEYFAWAVRLAAPGAVIVIDNVIRSGGVINAGSADADIAGTRRLMTVIAEEQRATATAIQTVGSKGYDGFAIVVVAPPRPTE